MTRFIHDKFAKDYLEELLKDYGEVKASEKVSGEIKEIDVLFTPAKQQSSKLQILGLLGRLAENPKRRLVIGSTFFSRCLANSNCGNTPTTTDTGYFMVEAFG